MYDMKEWQWAILTPDTYEPVFQYPFLKNAISAWYKDKRSPWFPGKKCLLGKMQDDGSWKAVDVKDMLLAYDCCKEHAGDCDHCKH